MLRKNPRKLLRIGFVGCIGQFNLPNCDFFCVGALFSRTITLAPNFNVRTFATLAQLAVPSTNVQFNLVVLRGL